MINWKHLPAKVILEVAELCDGHTIFKVEAFTGLGVPQELIEQYVQDLKGVYGLDVIESINREFELPYLLTVVPATEKADVCRNQIRDYLGSLKS